MGVIVIAVIIVVISTAYYNRKFSYQARVTEDAFGCPKAYRLIANPKSIKAIKDWFSKPLSHDERYFYAVAISREANLALLKEWAEQEPNNPQANLCYGVRMVQEAWYTRGYGREYEVDENAWPHFHHQAAIARDHLEIAARQAPSDPTPYIFLITCATWLQEGIDRYFYLYNQATALDSECWGANMTMMIALSQKWGGDNQHMLSFAKQVAASAPEGSDLKLLPFKAYIELLKYAARFEEDEDAVNELLNDHQVIAYSKELLAQWQAGHKAKASTVFVKYNALSWLWFIKQKDDAAQVMASLDNKISAIHLRWTGLEGRFDELTEYSKASAL